MQFLLNVTRCFMSYFAFCCLLFYMQTVADQLPRLGMRELICLLLFTCNDVVSIQRGFFFRCVLVVGCVIILWQSLGLPYTFLY